MERNTTKHLLFGMLDACRRQDNQNEDKMAPNKETGG